MRAPKCLRARVKTAKRVIKHVTTLALIGAFLLTGGRSRFAK